MKQTILACLGAAVLLADVNGIPPRKSSSDYPAHEAAGGMTLAAALLTPAEGRNVFTADLDRAGYLVFEVAVYPDPGGQFDMAPDQFTLRANTTGTIIASVPPDATVERIYHGKSASAPQVPGKLNVSTTTVIGYESGSPGRRGGVYAGQSTSVGVGGPPPDAPPPPPPSGASQPPVSRDQLLAELTAREFPDTKVTAAVAGYLYFPKPDVKPKTGFYELTYTPADRSGERIELQVPAKK